MNGVTYMANSTILKSAVIVTSFLSNSLHQKY